MKVIFVVLVIAFAFCEYLEMEEIITQINNDPTSTWKAEANKFTKMSVEELKSLLVCEVTNFFPFAKKEHYRGNDIPSEFDSRTEWPQCSSISHIRDQGHCGSCWAHGLSESMSDRLCIRTNGSTAILLAPQDPVSCDHLNQGCNGGIPLIAVEYARHSGIVDEDCFPYVSGDGHVPSCPKKCQNGDDFKSRKHKAKAFKHNIGEKSIQSVIVESGPVHAAFTVFQDFMSYKSGVYQHKSGSELGGHVVKILGYGVEDGTDYWLAANSWTTSWGEDGYFKIIRGKNECGIEQTIYSFTM